MPASICGGAEGLAHLFEEPVRLDDAQPSPGTQRRRQRADQRLQPMGVVQGVEGGDRVEHAVAEGRQVHVHVHHRVGRTAPAQRLRRRQVVVDVDADRPPAARRQPGRGPGEVGADIEQSSATTRAELSDGVVEHVGEARHVLEVFVLPEVRRAVVVGQRREGIEQRPAIGQQRGQREIGRPQQRRGIQLADGLALPGDRRGLVGGAHLRDAVVHRDLAPRSRRR